MSERRWKKLPKQKSDKRLRTARKMPPLHHTLPGKDFDSERSQVLEWIVEQPELVNYLFDHIRYAGHIQFDPKRRTWVGVDYRGN